MCEFACYLIHIAVQVTQPPQIICNFVGQSNAEPREMEHERCFVSFLVNIYFQDSPLASKFVYYCTAFGGCFIRHFGPFHYVRQGLSALINDFICIIALRATAHWAHGYLYTHFRLISILWTNKILNVCAQPQVRTWIRNQVGVRLSA